MGTSRRRLVSAVVLLGFAAVGFLVCAVVGPDYYAVASTASAVAFGLRLREVLDAD